ncbi:hypothetical protein [Cryptosporangium arvum]|jgi:hypothetical protein|uniref:hypothetical protein n=1 Tax=Cryptosporangium arvum TaxID=80871 RepID=UPI0004B1894E|nr:hypothetical protein [Cryptosporangium arvum]
MLAMNKYPQDYVDACRRELGVQVDAFRALGSTPEVREFEPVFFNNLVLRLEHHFVHRTRTLEKKDGNPLNEVRVVAMSLLSNGGVMGTDKAIRLDPATSVLKLRVGDPIGLREADFLALSTAFFADLEAKFV